VTPERVIELLRRGRCINLGARCANLGTPRRCADCDDIEAAITYVETLNAELGAAVDVSRETADMHRADAVRLHNERESARWERDEATAQLALAMAWGEEIAERLDQAEGRLAMSHASDMILMRLLGCESKEILVAARDLRRTAERQAQRDRVLEVRAQRAREWLEGKHDREIAIEAVRMNDTPARSIGSSSAPLCWTCGHTIARRPGGGEYCPSCFATKLDENDRSGK
jgi:hypothetical protein